LLGDLHGDLHADLHADLHGDINHRNVQIAMAAPDPAGHHLW